MGVTHKPKCFLCEQRHWFSQMCPEVTTYGGGAESPEITAIAQASLQPAQKCEVCGGVMKKRRGAKTCSPRCRMRKSRGERSNS